MTGVILNDTQRGFLEELLLQGRGVVTYEQLADLIPYEHDVAKRRFVSQLRRAGWLVPIKKGVYQVASDISALGTLTLSRYVVAQVLLPGSYVSFESALQFHGLHDQLMQTVTSVARKQLASVTRAEFVYRFVKTTEQNFFGYEEHTLDGEMAQIASVEKAIIDMIQFHRSDSSTDRVLEILAEHRHDLDQARLMDYLLRANLTTQRIFGLLFDRLGLAYDPRLEESARSRSADSRLSARAQTYNAKWRIYYDPAMFRHNELRHQA
jgi:predicted transcriptional regulator of viral defense system